VSLVNDMLRDLDARRAAPAEREQLDGIHAVDEAGSARRERYDRLRHGLLIASAVVLVAIALFVLSKRLATPTEPEVVSPAPIEEVMPQALAAIRLLEVLPQNDSQRFTLQLLLDRPVSYQRIDASGSVSFQLQDVQFTGAPRTGRIETNGQSLSWSVEAQGEGVQVLLVGMGDRINVADRLESAGDRAQLWLDVSLANAETDVEQPVASLPVAEQADPGEDALPDWVTREVAPAEPDSVSKTALEQQATPRPAAVVERPAAAGPSTLSIGAHQPDALAEARQALAQGEHLLAIRQLQTLHQAQPDNPEISRWLARGYLAAGDTAALLAWLPAQLAARPFDAELRELLARGQLQVGDKAAAIATLQQNAPELQRNAGYHALLAALYQQAGDWSASAATYRRLIAARPNQGAWQLGLAIALEQLDQAPQAARHYHLALRGQGLDGSARQFAAERADSLGGTK